VPNGGDEDFTRKDRWEIAGNASEGGARREALRIWVKRTQMGKQTMEETNISTKIRELKATQNHKSNREQRKNLKWQKKNHTHTHNAWQRKHKRIV